MPTKVLGVVGVKGTGRVANGSWCMAEGWGDGVAGISGLGEFVVIGGIIFGVGGVVGLTARTEEISLSSLCFDQTYWVGE